MESNEIQSHFSNSDCSVCGSKGPTVMHYHNGTPVLTMCKACDNHSHEAIARRDIDAWLNGGSASVFGR